jgi:chorismate mutase
LNSIPELRQEIDQIHKELHSLLLRRRDLTMAIWKIKQEQGQPFFNAEREEQIIADFVKMGTGPNAATDPAFNELLKGVMNSVLREYEKYLKSKYSP